MFRLYPNVNCFFCLETQILCLGRSYTVWFPNNWVVKNNVSPVNEQKQDRCVKSHFDQLVYYIHLQMGNFFHNQTTISLYWVLRIQGGFDISVNSFLLMAHRFIWIHAILGGLIRDIVDLTQSKSTWEGPLDRTKWNHKTYQISPTIGVWAVMGMSKTWVHV